MNSLFFKCSFIFGCKSINTILKCNATFIRFFSKKYRLRKRLSQFLHLYERDEIYLAIT